MSVNQIDYIDVSKLYFDSKNPRIPSTLDGKDEKSVIEWMLSDASILELMQAIGINGYFAGEPLLVAPRDGNNSYIVVEGNRRLTALKLLHAPELASSRKNAIKAVLEETTERPDSIPCIVFEKREDILDYLGFRHVTGVKSWGSLAKSRYVYQMIEENSSLTLDENCAKIAQIIGSRRDYVKKMFMAYGLYLEAEKKDFYNIKGLNEETIEFSYLHSAATKYSNISVYLNIDYYADKPLRELSQEHLESMVHWLYKKDERTNVTRIGESRNLGLLNNVIANENAFERFKNGMPLTEASRYAHVPDEVYRTALMEAYQRLKDAREYEHLIQAPKQHDLELLNNISGILKTMQAAYNSKLLEAND